MTPAGTLRSDMAPLRPSTPVRLAVGLAVALTLWAGPVAAQEVPPTTVGDLLVPGDPAATSAPPATTTPAPTTTAPTAAEEGGLLDLELDANEKVWVIVGALVLVAVLIAVLTVVYWRHTKPGVERPSRRERRARRREGRDETHVGRRDRRDPFAGDEPSAGPLDVDELLGRPEPSRSVFATGPEDEAPGPR